MTGVLSQIYLYKGSEVDDQTANYLIEEIYQKKGLFLLNTELTPENKKSYDELKKSDVTSQIHSRD